MIPVLPAEWNLPGDLLVGEYNVVPTRKVGRDTTRSSLWALRADTSRQDERRPVANLAPTSRCPIHLRLRKVILRQLPSDDSLR